MGGFMSEKSNWMNDPELTNIPVNKLMFLESMLFESQKHSGKELMPFFMSLAMKAKKENITFSENEINTIIPVLKKCEASMPRSCRRPSPHLPGTVPAVL